MDTSSILNVKSDRLPPPPPKTIQSSLNLKEITIEWLAGDGSDRCYYRIFSPELEKSLVLMQLSDRDAQALRENGYEWIQIGEVLRKHHLAVPKTVQTLPDYAAIVIEDYGDIMMESLAQQALKDERVNDVVDIYTNVSKSLASSCK